MVKVVLCNVQLLRCMSHEIHQNHVYGAWLDICVTGKTDQMVSTDNVCIKAVHSGTTKLYCAGSDPL